MLFFFYLFSGLIVLSAMMVGVSRNPVYSVLYLIFAFFNAAGLFLLLGAEFIAMLLVIVYVGAVAVLWLFVVMMLDLQQQAARYNIVSLGIGLLFLVEVIVIALSFNNTAELAPLIAQTSNTRDIAGLLYTDYIVAFQASGVILLVAMVSAIALTLNKRNKPSKKQNIADQLARDASSVEYAKVKIGKGVPY